MNAQQTTPATLTASDLSAPGLSAPEFFRPSLPYHRLLRRFPGATRWWRPISVIAVGIGMYLAFLLPLLILGAMAQAGVFGASWTPTEELMDPTNPTDVIVGLGIVALLLPSALLGMRWGGRAAGALHSVAHRVRWGLLGRAAAIVLPVLAVVIVVPFLIAPPHDFAWPAPTIATFAVYGAILLLVPLQCAAEEYVFRGLPMQLLGARLRSPLWGILAPVPLFVLGHGYDRVGQIDIAVFAICMGLLAWKSGGLELPVVVHTANNLILFLLAPFSRSSLEQGAVEPVVLLFTLPLTIDITAVLWAWVSRRYGVRALEPVRTDRV